MSGRGGVGASRLVDRGSPASRATGPAIPGHPVHRGAGTRPGGVRADHPGLHAVAGRRSTTQELRRAVGSGAEPISRLLPALATRLAGQIPHARRDSIAPERRGAWIGEAIQGLLERAGERQPILLVLEDLHHADAGTRNLATFLARVARPARVCLLLTYGRDRITRGHPLQAQLSAISGAADPPAQLELGPLDRFELAQLVDRDRGRAPDRGRAAARRRTLRGRPADCRGGPRRPARAPRALARIDAGRARPRRASPAGPRRRRRVLRLLAPAGGRSSGASLPPSRRRSRSSSTASRRDPRLGPRRGDGVLDADLRAGVVEAIDHGFLIERADRRLEIRHELVAQAIEADLLPVQRRRHHIALAAALRLGPGLRTAHWLAAYETARARAAALATAAIAEKLDSAADALAAASWRWSSAPPAAARAADGRLLFETAGIALAAGRADRALAYLESAAGRFGEREDAATAASIHETLGRVARALGDHDRALAEHRRAASITPDGHDCAARVRPRLARADAHAPGPLRRGDPVGGQAVEVARQVGPEARSVEATRCARWASRMPGAQRERGHRPAPGCAASSRANSTIPTCAFRATLNLTTALALFGRRDEAIEVTRDAIERARADGLEVAYGNSMRGNIAEALFSAGRWTEARETIRTALEWSPDAVAFAEAVRHRRHAGGRDQRRRACGEPARLAPARDRPRPGPAARGPRDPCGGVLRPVAGRRRQTRAGPWNAAGRSSGGAEDWALAARMAATYLEVHAAVAADARERHALPEITGARQRGKRILAEAETVLRASGVAPGAPSRRRPTRISPPPGPSSPASKAATTRCSGTPPLRAGSAPASRTRWPALAGGRPRPRCRAATHASRAAARGPLLEAVRIARELGARPLLRELTNLASRALITIPGPVAADAQAGRAAADP